MKEKHPQQRPNQHQNPPVQTAPKNPNQTFGKPSEYKHDKSGGKKGCC